MKTAMILAAGRGERLKPITHYMHKSLCQVKGKPLIEHHVHNLASAGFKKIVINHAYLGEQLRYHLGNGSKWNVNIHYSSEPPGGLETGGGIINALPLLGEEPFVTVNADIYTDFNFAGLREPENALGHIILAPNPSHNQKGDFGLDDSKFITNENKEHTFLGIACYQVSAFSELPYGRYSIVDSLLRPLADKKQLSGEFFKGLWIDVGSQERLAEARAS